MAKKGDKNYLEEAIQNIRTDRAAASSLLTELMRHMQQQGKHSHQEYGTICAKYLETLQRSNEQLVKITSILSKETSTKVGLSSEMKDEILDIIQDGGSVEGDTEDDG